MNIEIDREVDGRWIAEIPDLPGVLSYGKSREETPWRRAKALAFTRRSGRPGGTRRASPGTGGIFAVPGTSGWPSSKANRVLAIPVLVMIACAMVVDAVRVPRPMRRRPPNRPGLGLVPWPASVNSTPAIWPTGRPPGGGGLGGPSAAGGRGVREGRAASGVGLSPPSGALRGTSCSGIPRARGGVHRRRGDQAVVEGAALRGRGEGTTTPLGNCFGPARPPGASPGHDRRRSAEQLSRPAHRRGQGAIIPSTRSASASACAGCTIRFLQLHLTDDPAFTFPSTAFPKLAAQPQHGGPAYTLEELRDLERYACERGVAIVPEMEVPGHAGAMNRAMPELFKIRGTKPYGHHASINFANPAVVQAVDTLVGEMCEVFRSSPYFHVGGDEADLAFAHQHEDFQAAFKQFGLGEKGQGQLYRHFLIQMDEIVRKHGKRMIVWEGFHRDPRSQFQIPKDVIVMEYECPFYPPEQLVADGFTVVNAAWTPLYVVNRHRWSPRRILTNGTCGCSGRSRRATPAWPGTA